ncbi:MAG: hypothetical protein NC218_04535 [Acetobacter sp.]|nr:hypothetical protein [Acetobacter sp.]
MNVYALRHKKTQQYLSIETDYVCYYDGGDEPDDIEVIVSLGLNKSSTIWVTTDLLYATFVRSVSANNWTSCPETPSHSFECHELEVVNLLTETVVNVPDCPTSYEIRRKLNKLNFLKSIYSDDYLENMKKTRDYTIDDYVNYMKINKK